MTLDPLAALRALWKPSDPGFRADITTDQRAVLAVLVMHANERGVCWPSLTAIQGGTALGRSTVVRVLDALESAGLLARNRTRNGRNTTTYTLTPSAPTSPRAALVPERDQSQSGTGVVPERDLGSARAGPELPIELPIELPTSTEGASRSARRTPRKRAGKQKAEQPQGWTIAAGKIWETNLGGLPNYGHIGRALKPLIEKHGEAEVLVTFDKYLKQEPAQYVSPDAFVRKFGVWQGSNGAAKGRAPLRIDAQDLAGWTTHSNQEHS